MDKETGVTTGNKKWTKGVCIDYILQPGPLFVVKVSLSPPYPLP